MAEWIPGNNLWKTLSPSSFPLTSTYVPSHPNKIKNKGGGGGDGDGDDNDFNNMGHYISKPL